MRTNIEIDDELMARAMDLSKLKTKREVVERALQDYVDTYSRRNLLDLFGQDILDEGYDYKALRGGETLDIS